MTQEYNIGTTLRGAGGRRDVGAASRNDSYILATTSRPINYFSFAPSTSSE